MSYEQEVGAAYLSCLLTEDIPFGLNSGKIVKIRFQSIRTQPDDIVLVVEDKGKERKVAFQVKYDLTFSSNQLFNDVIAQCWHFFANDPTFIKENDRMGIIVGIYEKDVDKEFQRLLEWARTKDNQEFKDEVFTEGAASDKKREYYQLTKTSLTAAKGAEITDEELWQFLRHFLVVHLDLEYDGTHRNQCISQLRRKVPNNDSNESSSLFDRLSRISARYNSNGGTIDYQTLIGEVLDLLSTDNTKSVSSDESLKTQQFRDYLKYVAELENTPNSLDGINLAQYYVQTRAIRQSSHFWENDKSYEEGIFSNDWQITDFLTSKDWLVLVGASFGIGKTSLVKHIASNLAKQLLQASNIDDVFVPIFVSLKDKFKNVYYQEDFNHVLSHIVLQQGKSSERKILVILDGLDEHGEDMVALSKLLEDLHTDHPNMKILMTSRLKAGIPSVFKLTYFVKLLPFDKKQVDAFFLKYGVPLKYENLTSYGLKDEETCKPLFCWMLAVTYSREFERIAFLRRNWSSNMRKALIYQHFIHSLIRGKHKKEQIDLAQFYYTEKRTLRKIAALKLIHSTDLTHEVLNTGLAEFGLEVKPDELEPIITSYFNLRTADSSKIIDFIHESFKEYLLAEYLLECIIEGKSSYINIGMPSEETIQFFDGILEIVKRKDRYLTGLMLYNDNAFLKSFRYQEGEKWISSDNSDNLSKVLISRAKDLLGIRDLIFPAKDVLMDKQWVIAKIDDSLYPLKWIHRWLSLYVLVKLSKKVEVAGSTVVDLLSNSASKMPGYLKNMSLLNLSSRVDLANLDFNGANLRRTSFNKAVMSGCNLRSADLTRSRLIHTDLTGANLEDTILIRADLSRASLKGAKFHDPKKASTDKTMPSTMQLNPKYLDTRLARINLSGADLTGITLNGFDLSNTRLNSTNLSGAELTYVKLSGAKLRYADLSGSKLIWINLDGKTTDLSHAILQGATINNSNLSFCKLKSANLRGSYLSNTDLRNADLSGAQLQGCTLENVQLDEVIVDNKTKTTGIILSSDELEKMNEPFRRIVLRDNPHMKKSPSKKPSR